MDSIESFPLHFGWQARETFPLSRYLPPVPGGAIEYWLQNFVKKGSWVLDPFGSTPAAAIEAAQAGYLVLVASNNPITTFMIDVLASGHQEREFKSALAELALIKRGTERLEIQLRNLYITSCASCGKMVDAEAFLWRRGEPEPYARYYKCPYCKDEGERAITLEDLERFHFVSGGRLHYARAAQRIQLESGKLQTGAEQVLSLYSPRAIHFVFTVLNQIEGMPDASQQKKLLYAMMISVCDQANFLWNWPTGRTRPRQLTIPPQYRENNLWLALENSIAEWSTRLNQIPVTFWPDLPSDSSGICIYKGRLRDIPPLSGIVPVQAVISILPRPNQAFWSLSAVWSAWFFGKNAITPMRGLLDRSRYDWDWHSRALQKLFAMVSQHIGDDTLFFGVIPELVPGFLLAVFSALYQTDYCLKTIALSREQELAQAIWKKNTVELPESMQNFDLICLTAMQNYMRYTVEPASYLDLLAISIRAVSTCNTRLKNVSETDTSTCMDEIQSCMERLLVHSNYFVREGNKSQNQSIESGLWWSVDYGHFPGPPMADQIELTLLNFLQETTSCSWNDIWDYLQRIFSWTVAPSDEYLRILLESYAVLSHNIPRKWNLSLQESSSARSQDIQEIMTVLDETGMRLGYSVDQHKESSRVIWTSSNGELAYQYWILSTSAIGKIVFEQIDNHDDGKKVFILPGSRSKLLVYKLEQNPPLKDMVNRDWHMIKYRHIRRVLSGFDLTGEEWDKMLKSDPIRWEEAVQMNMFDQLR